LQPFLKLLAVFTSCDNTADILKLSVRFAVVFKTPVFCQISTQKHIAARVLINSAANDAASASRDLWHNVSINIRHNFLLYLTGEASFTNGNNPGPEDCQRINRQHRHYLRQPVQDSRS
jgi:hypothetical protein